MPTIGARLDRLRLVYHRPEPPAGPTTFDPTRLTMREQDELDTLLAPIAPLPGERWNLEPLTAEQLDRSLDLMNKAHGVPPSPAYVGMRHRDPGIGPCRCPACEKEPTPT